VRWDSDAAPRAPGGSRGSRRVPRHRRVRGLEPRGADPVTDLVVGLHIRRLVSHGGDTREFDPLLRRLRAAAGLDADTAAAADRITATCDRIAFDFCLEEPSSGESNGIAYALYDRVRVEPSDESFLDAIAFGRERPFDAFVAVGGGSTIDTRRRTSTRRIRRPISSTTSIHRLAKTRRCQVR